MSPSFIPRVDQPPATEVDPSCVGNAVTTLDDSACILQSHPFLSPGTELADVPEEEEGYPWARHSQCITRPAAASASIRLNKSYPNIRSCTKASASILTRASVDVNATKNGEWHVDQESILPIPGHQSEDIPINPRISQRISTDFRGLEESWEEYIDFCYENEAEADCDFEWDATKRDTVVLSPPQLPPLDRDSHVVSESGDAIFHEVSVTTAKVPGSSQVAFGTSHGNDSEVSMPALDAMTPDSLQSSTESIQEAITPLTTPATTQTFGSRISSSYDSDVYQLEHPVIVPRDYESQIGQDDFDTDLIADRVLAKEHYPMFAPRINTDVRYIESPRSSGSPLSKCNSMESMALSQRASIIRKHRTTGSIDSLPELSYSRYGQEQFDIVNEQLVDHMAILSTGNTVPEQSATMQHRQQRSSSLAKDVARQSILKKTSTTSIQDPEGSPTSASTTNVPRDRANSDAGQLLKANPSSFSGRGRSASVATNMSGKKSGRSSYSLFPPATSHRVV